MIQRHLVRAPTEPSTEFHIGEVQTILPKEKLNATTTITTTKTKTVILKEQE